MREVPPDEWDGLELDAYYRRPYVESAALLDAGRPFLLEHDGAFFAGIERDGPRDVVTPYGYGGPTGDGFWDAYEDVGARARRREHLRPLPPAAGEPAGRADPRRGARADGRLAGRAGARPARRPALQAPQQGAQGRERRRDRRRSTTASASSSPLYEDTMRRIDADPFYLFEPAYWERLGELPLARFDAAIDGEVVAQRALPGEPAVAALPPQRHDRRGPRDRRLDARPARGRALGAGERLRALPPRRRPRRQGRLAAPLQGALRPGGPGPGGDRQGDPRRGRLPRAERRRGAATTASSPLTASRSSSFTA